MHAMRCRLGSARTLAPVRAHTLATLRTCRVNYLLKLCYYLDR